MQWRSAVFALFLTAGLALAVNSFQAQQPIGRDEVRIRSWVYKPQAATLRVERNEVQVGVVVRDSKGQVVSGLTPDDFAVYDDGKKQAVSGFSVETRSLRTAMGTTATTPVQAAQEPGQQAQQPVRPRYVALYFDDLHTKSGDMNHVRVAAENFVRQGLSTNDQVALFTASSKVTVDFTGDASKVLDAVANLKSEARVFDSGVCPRITPHDAYMIVNFPNSDAYQTAVAGAIQCNCTAQFDNTLECQKEQERLVLREARQTWEPIKELSENTLKNLQAVVDYLAKRPGERVLVIASAGFLTGSLEDKVDAVVDNALRAGIVINALDAKGLYTEDPSHGQMQNELAGNSAAGAMAFAHEAESFGSDLMSVTGAMADFTVGTGGRFFHNRNDLTAGYYSLATAPEAEYLLGFAPEKERLNGSFHKLKVEVNTPGKFYVQARPGYFATKKEPSGPTAEEKIDAEVRGAEEKSDFALSVSEKTGTDSKGNRELSVQTRVDIKKLPFEKQQDRHVDMLTFVAALFDAEGRLVTAKEAQMELALKPESFDRFSKSGISGGMSLEAPPGNYRLRVVVEEAEKGQMSTASQTVQLQ